MKTSLINKMVGIKNPKWIEGGLEEVNVGENRFLFKGNIRAIFVCEIYATKVQVVLCRQ